MVWTYLLFIGLAKIGLVRHGKRGEKMRQTEKEVGRQDQGMDRSGVHLAPGGSGKQKNGENSL